MEIYVSSNGKESGPFAKGLLEAYLREGIYSPTDLGWCEGMVEWVPLGNIFPNLPKKKKDSRKKTTPFRMAVAVVIAVGISATICAILLRDQIFAWSSNTFRSSVDLDGQVFIVTKGGESIKLGLAQIAIFNRTEIHDAIPSLRGGLQAMRQSGSSWNVDFRSVDDWLPKAVSFTQTDADGRYKISGKKGDILIATCQRQVFDDTEKYVWVIPLTQTSHIDLSNANLWSNDANDVIGILDRFSR